MGRKKGFAEEDEVGEEGLQKRKGARKGQTAGSELGGALPRHQGQWKPVQPCLGGVGCSSKT